jgi:hypothetical protein
VWLVPALSPGDIVGIDNLASDKSPEIRNAIEAEGAGRRFLPGYSQQFFAPSLAANARTSATNFIFIGLSLLSSQAAKTATFASDSLIGRNTTPRQAMPVSVGSVEPCAEPKPSLPRCWSPI